ncbi:hypothetical protein JCM5350_007697 [Sporobolomyces pararoseus]
MASLKIASLLLRTLSKPIATKIKQRAKDHEGFKSRTIAMAQFLHRAEMNLRVSLLGESPKHIRPLSESRAIESGANFLSEGFLFAVAATIIIGETYRSRLSESKRRDAVRESLESHESELEQLRSKLKEFESYSKDEKKKFDELGGIVEQVVQIGLKGGFGGDSDSSTGKSEAWERHLRIAELARAFGTNGRVLREEEEEDHDEDKSIDFSRIEGGNSTTLGVERNVVDSGRNRESENRGEGEAESKGEEGNKEVERKPLTEGKKDREQENSSSGK